MEAPRSETSYALMDTAFLRQVVSADAGASNSARAPAGTEPRTLWKSWYAGAAGRFFAIGKAMAERR